MIGVGEITLDGFIVNYANQKALHKNLPNGVVVILKIDKILRSSQLNGKGRTEAVMWIPYLELRDIKKNRPRQFLTQFDWFIYM